MVKNRWSEQEAARHADDGGADPVERQLALQIYASRLIGSEAELVQHGGGNTSCKLLRKDLFDNDVRVLHIKASGHDLAQLAASGMPAVRLDGLLALRALERLDDADMVNAVRSGLVISDAPNPSIEILLHAYLPHPFVNHTHATAMLALANLPNAGAAVKDIFGDTVVCVPFHKPGFALARAAAEIYEANPKVEGLLLLNHGHFAFAASPKDAYELIIKHTNMVEGWLKSKRGKQPKTRGRAAAKMVARANGVLPVLRGILGARNARFCGDEDAAMPMMALRAGADVQTFLARPDLATLAGRGVATPDHVIRIKNYPMFLSHKAVAGGAATIGAAVDAYIKNYTEYFERYAARAGEAKTMLNPAPGLAWIEGVGIVGIGADACAAAIAADLGEQNIAAMSNGEDCGGFFPVGEEQLFEMEYWALEQAKLGSSPVAELTGRVVLVTGGGGAIGLAIAQAFAERGANIFLVDLAEAALAAGLGRLGAGHDGLMMDITAKGAADDAINACVARFGGLDILVSNAGAAWSGEMSGLDDAVLRKSFELNFFAHQSFAKSAVNMFETQGRGGQILFNVSKQAVNPGKGFGAYGLPKAATFFLLRQLALELGAHGVRVNGVNADRIRSGLLDDAFITKRSQARGIDEKTYMAGNLLQREVEARHVAEAFVALALSARTTAHVMTVDGGNIEAALR